MKFRQFSIVLLMVAAALTVRADYLYWQISSSAISECASEANYACVHFVPTGGEDSELTSLDGSEPITSNEFTYDNGKHILIESIQDYSVQINVSDLAETAGYFYIELVNWDSSTSTAKTVATGEQVTYANLSDNISGSLMDVPTAWTGGEFTAVPEPTAGMLMLWGLGLVALRRRRKV